MKDGKPFYESKTFYGFLAVALGSACYYFTDDIEGAVALITAGFGLVGFGIRAAL